jgi:hypothetical protein
MWQTLRFGIVADAELLDFSPLYAARRVVSFLQGAIDQIEAAAISATVAGKHTFRYADGIISRHITALAFRQNLHHGISGAPHGTFPFIINSSTRALSTRESDDHLPA